MEVIAVGLGHALAPGAGFHLKDVVQGVAILGGPLGRSQGLGEEAHHQVEVFVQQALVNGDGPGRAVVDAVARARHPVQVDPDHQPQPPGRVGRRRALHIDRIHLAAHQVIQAGP
ncbi:hypothetical protein D3C80_1832460 [compost metagenome]